VDGAHDVVSTYSLILREPVDISLLSVGSHADGLSSWSRRMNIDDHIDQSPSQSTKIGASSRASRSWRKAPLLHLVSISYRFALVITELPIPMIN